MAAIGKCHQLLGLLLVGLSTTLSGCNLSGRNLPLVQSESQPERELTDLIYGDFIFQEQENTVIIPLQIKGDRGWDLAKDSSISSRESNNLTVNFIFHNLDRDTSNLLLNRQAIVTQYQQLTPQAQAKNESKIRDYSGVDASGDASRSPQDYTGKYWLYHIIEVDTNNDATLSNQDAIRGYISDLEGNNLIPVTPENSQLRDWFFSAEYSQILMQVQTKSESELEFSEQSPSAFYIYELETYAQKQITPENTQIKQWYLQGLNDKFIVLEVISDTNQDNQFKADDAITLYLYDLAAEKLYPVTSEDSQLQTWQFEEKSNFLFAKIREDSNGDRVFDETDSIQIVKLNLDRLSNSTEILQESLQQEIQQLYQITSP